MQTPWLEFIKEQRKILSYPTVSHEFQNSTEEWCSGWSAQKCIYPLERTHDSWLTIHINVAWVSSFECDIRSREQTPWMEYEVSMMNMKCDGASGGVVFFIYRSERNWFDCARQFLTSNMNMSIYVYCIHVFPYDFIHSTFSLLVVNWWVWYNKLIIWQTSPQFHVCLFLVQHIIVCIYQIIEYKLWPQSAHVFDQVNN